MREVSPLGGRTLPPYATGMMPASPNPIVITGCGWVTPFAAGGIPQVLAGGQTCPDPSTLERGYWPVPDDLPKGYPHLSAEIRQDKGAWITAIAFEHARRQAAPPDSLPAERVGMVLGCALAGQLGMITFANEVRAQSARFVSPIHFPQTVGNYIAGALARAYNIRGPNNTVAAGLASGLDAVIQGSALLTAGAADLIYAGGADALSRELAVGLAEPGVTLSEGACLFALERRADAAARGATPLAAITGFSRLSGEPPPSSFPSNSVISRAGLTHPGAIAIESRIGRCCGALGAAAVAAALGAGSGRTPHAVIIADADGAHVSVLEISINPGT